MHDADGNIIKWFGSNTDFDEIKKAEEQLRNFNKDLEQKVEERTKELQRSKILLNETGRLARVGGWEIDLLKALFIGLKLPIRFMRLNPTLFQIWRLQSIFMLLRQYR